jgi:hypothetical protein
VNLGDLSQHGREVVVTSVQPWRGANRPARTVSPTGAISLVLNCRGSGGFEGARDVLTLSLRTTKLDTETRRVSVVFL